MSTVYFEDLVQGQEFVGDEVMVDKDEMLDCARKNASALPQSGIQMGIPGRVRLACQLPTTYPTRRSAPPQDGGPSKRLSSKPGRGVIDSVGTLINQNDEEVLRVEVASLIATRPSA